jgi:hypothetical protein
MKIFHVTFDNEAEAGYIYLSDEPVHKTIQLSPSVNFEMDAEKADSMFGTNRDFGVDIYPNP